MRAAQTLLALVFVLGVLLACKRKEEAQPTPIASATAATVEPTATASASADPSAAASAEPSATATTTATATTAPTTTAPTTVKGAFKVGEAVDVEWHGDWWKATVLAVSPGPTYKIHYVGWASSYDETVGPARIRAATAAVQGAAPRPPASASARASASSTPALKCPPDQTIVFSGAKMKQVCAKLCTNEKDCPNKQPCMKQPTSATGDATVQACLP